MDLCIRRRLEREVRVRYHGAVGVADADTHPIGEDEVGPLVFRMYHVCFIFVCVCLCLVNKIFF